MKAEDLSFQDLLGYADGKLQQSGRRMLIHDLFAQVQFRKDLIEMVGPGQARRIITRFGYFWGQADASAMKRLYTWDSLEELIRACPRLLSLQGISGIVLASLECNTEAARYRILLESRDCAEREPSIVEFREGDCSACWKVIGYASGYCSFCTDSNIYFCQMPVAENEPMIFRLEGRDSGSWDDEAGNQLQYFKFDDIKAKIAKLSEHVRHKETELRRSREQLEKALSGPSVFPAEIRNQRFLDILKTAGRVALFDTSLLITGETGVGKEVLARLIHRISGRSNGPFITVNCLALPETLCESELFGHASGSFTGAVKDHAGLFEEAGGGTIFLDEIGDVSPAIQMKLLRVLQDHEITRLGENKPRQVDVRVIAATNRNLEQKVADGAFREDLYYRLCVFNINLPALRDRREDILPLARAFVKRCAERLSMPELRLNSSCLEHLVSYNWPGNIRELENAIEHAAVICTGGEILPENLPAQVTAPRKHSRRGERMQSLAELEMEYIEHVLRQTRGHRTEAARILGISEATLYRKLKLLESA